MHASIVRPDAAAACHSMKCSLKFRLAVHAVKLDKVTQNTPYEWLRLYAVLIGSSAARTCVVGSWSRPEVCDM